MKPTAPVKWQIGQALLPAHLNAQENFLIADSALRHFSLGSAPQYGITQLSWDEPLLRKGSVFITQFQLIMPSHNRVVDYPGNAHVVSNPIELAELAHPAVYFFVLEELDAGTDPNRIPTQSGRAVSHRYFKLVFSATEHLPAHLEYLLEEYDIEYQGCLAIFRRDEQGFWAVTDEYIPPLVQVGNSPYLRNSLNRLRAQLQHYREGLQQSYTGEPLPLKQYVNVSNCVRSIQNAWFMLENLAAMRTEPGEITPHPYDLYADLYRLYLDLSLYREQWPENSILPYRHLQIHYVFQQLFRKLEALLINDNKHGRSSQFVLKEGIMATPLPSQTEKSDTLFFIIKTHHKPILALTDLPKISCLSRLNMMYDYSLNGLRLKPVKENAIGFSFGKDVQVFQIENDQEVDYLFSENSVAFYDHPSLQGREYYIYSQSS